LVHLVEFLLDYFRIDLLERCVHPFIEALLVVTISQTPKLLVWLDLGFQLCKDWILIEYLIEVSLLIVDVSHLLIEPNQGPVDFIDVPKIRNPL
jgi:hypothetical protein